MLKFFCRLIISVIVGVLFINSSVSAEIQTYSGVGEYTMSEYELSGNAKQRAKFYAVRDAQRQAGVYIKSYSQSENLTLTNDEIIAISAGIVQIIETKITSIPAGDTVKFHAEVKINIDTSNVDEYLKRDPKERENLILQNKELEKSIAKQEEQIKVLKKLIAEAKTPEEIERIKEGFAKIDREFLANQKIEEGIRLRTMKNYSAALENFNQAIESDPNNFFAYMERGGLYEELQDYNKVIKDYSKTAELKPDYFMLDAVYNNLGNAYLEIADYNNAIESFNKSLSLNFNKAEVYLNRGNVYADLKNYELALADYTKAIELNPNFWEAYYNRGLCYVELGNFDKAQADYQKAEVLGYKS